jgi:UDP-glucuronate decarboxylase
MKLMNSSPEFTGPVNLGNPAEFTIRQLAEAVLGLTSSNSKLIFNPLPSDDPRQRQPDITLAKTSLQWQPSIELEEGLKKTIQYFKKELRL